MDMKTQTTTSLIEVKCGDFTLNAFGALGKYKINECEISLDGFRTNHVITINGLKDMKNAIEDFISLVERNNKLIDLEKGSKESEKPIDYKAVMDFVDNNPDRVLEIALQVIKEE